MVRINKRTAQRGEQYVQDRRGQSGRRNTAPRRGGGGVPIGKAGGGLGAIIAIIIALIFGGNIADGGSTTSAGPGVDINAPGGFDSGQQVPANSGATGFDPDADTVELMQFVMADTQDVWSAYFDQVGLQYQFTTMVIFEDQVATGCGNATSAVGPFYCPAPNDQNVYIDLGFFDELASPRFGAAGDFAQAYVVAHEVGHHIQSVTGISDQVRQAQASNPGSKNQLSVLQELQADCFAGVWGYSANQRTDDAGRPIIQVGDIEEGLAAAQAVGDDRIQSQAGMTVDPHTWTHGSARQRQGWFTAGLESGDPEKCDTYSVGADGF